MSRWSVPISDHRHTWSLRHRGPGSEEVSRCGPAPAGPSWSGCTGKARLLALGFVQEARRIVTAPADRGGHCAPRAEAFAACEAERSRVDGSDPSISA